MDLDTGTGRRHRHTHRPPALVNRVTLAVLRSRRWHRLLDGQLCELRYKAGDGRMISLPVLYAAAGDRYVVLVGDASDKRWWRHFRRPGAVEVCRGGRSRPGIGRILPPHDPGFPVAAETYVRRHDVPVGLDDQLLAVDLSPEGAT
ncbi:hypothetical protein AB0I37_27855 [Micromonospora purpureochromogenes]|uniref:hypothetical protein n=1 Tax=Micromonospora purpureochromogenes TaxID=47872 RepID=UPI0033C0F954